MAKRPVQPKRRGVVCLGVWCVLLAGQTTRAQTIVCPHSIGEWSLAQAAVGGGLGEIRGTPSGDFAAACHYAGRAGGEVYLTFRWVNGTAPLLGAVCAMPPARGGAQGTERAISGTHAASATFPEPATVSGERGFEDHARWILAEQIVPRAARCPGATADPASARPADKDGSGSAAPPASARGLPPSAPAAPAGPTLFGPNSPYATAPGLAAPSGAVPERDVTIRNMPSGPMGLGGQTRYDGETFFVESAPTYRTTHEIGPGLLEDFRMQTEVGEGIGGTGVVGVYLGVERVANGRPGDLFFGMTRDGLVLWHYDQTGWRDLPRQARPPQPRVRLEVERRQGRYVFLWDGSAVGEFTDAMPTRVMLFTGEGVQAQFRRFSVWRGEPATSGGPAAAPAATPPPPTPSAAACRWRPREGGWFGQGDIGAAYDCVCGGLVSAQSACGPVPPPR